MEFNLIAGGEAGHGLHTIEAILTELLFKLRLYFFSTRNYMSRIRGGHNFYMLRVAEHPVYALSGEQWDMLLAIDEESERRHRGELRQDGIFISPANVREIEKIAQEDFGDPRASNAVVVGVILAAIGCARQAVQKTVGDEATWERLAKGFDTADAWTVSGKYPILPQSKAAYHFDGNQALAFGAIMGGCRFMAGYPMTPATSIMTYFSQAALHMPVHFEQAEDEIAAVNMALGASYAGQRAMVATSGGGFALMQESVSLAGMTETPLVIIEAQRPGPSTGLPTRTEQGDLNFVLHSGQGEFPRAVFAPGSIEEAIDIASRSLDSADRFQVPVFILTDQHFADSRQLVEEEFSLTLRSRAYDAPGLEGEPYLRYKITEDGVSPMAWPGLSDALVKVDSDEHNEEGTITEDLSLRKRMVEKRLRKLEGLRVEARKPSFYGNRSARFIAICWGSNRLVVEEAVDKLIREGMDVASLHFSQVYPLTEAMVADLDPARQRLMIVENNATGQFAGLLMRELGILVKDHILKYNGECFTVRELRDRLKKIMEE